MGDQFTGQQYNYGTSQSYAQGMYGASPTTNVQPQPPGVEYPHVPNTIPQTPMQQPIPQAQTFINRFQQNFAANLANQGYPVPGYRAPTPMPQAPTNYGPQPGYAAPQMVPPVYTPTPTQRLPYSGQNSQNYQEQTPAIPTQESTRQLVSVQTVARDYKKPSTKIQLPAKKVTRKTVHSNPTKPIGNPFLKPKTQPLQKTAGSVHSQFQANTLPSNISTAIDTLARESAAQSKNDTTANKEGDKSHLEKPNLVSQLEMFINEKRQKKKPKKSDLTRTETDKSEENESTVKTIDTEKPKVKVDYVVGSKAKTSGANKDAVSKESDKYNTRQTRQSSQSESSSASKHSERKSRFSDRSGSDKDKHSSKDKSSSSKSPSDRKSSKRKSDDRTKDNKRIKTSESKKKQPISPIDDGDDPIYMTSQIFVGNIPSGTNKDDLLDIFDPNALNIEELWIGYNKNVKNDMCAFVKLESMKKAMKFQKENKGLVYMGRKLEIRLTAAADLMDYWVSSFTNEDYMPTSPLRTETDYLDPMFNPSLPPPSHMQQMAPPHIMMPGPPPPMMYQPVMLYPPDPMGGQPFPPPHVFPGTPFYPGAPGPPGPMPYYQHDRSRSGSRSPYRSRSRSRSPRGRRSRSFKSRSRSPHDKRHRSRSPYRKRSRQDSSSYRGRSSSPPYSNRSLTPSRGHHGDETYRGNHGNVYQPTLMFNTEDNAEVIQRDPMYEETDFIVYMSNISHNVRSEEIKDLVSSYKYHILEIATDKRSGDWIAYLHFNNRQDAQRIIDELEGKWFWNRQTNVELYGTQDMTVNMPTDDRYAGDHDIHHNFADSGRYRYRTLLHEYVDDEFINAPLIGLKYMTEYMLSSKATSAVYVCSVCELQCKGADVAEHVVGYKHRLKCFKKDNKSVYDKISYIKDKTDMLDECARNAAEFADFDEQVTTVYHDYPEERAKKQLDQIKRDTDDTSRRDRERDTKSRGSRSDPKTRDGRSKSKREEPKSRRDKSPQDPPSSPPADSTSDIFKRLEEYKKKVEEMKKTEEEKIEKKHPVKKDDIEKVSRLSFEDETTPQANLAASIVAEISSIRKQEEEQEDHGIDKSIRQKEQEMHERREKEQELQKKIEAAKAKRVEDERQRKEMEKNKIEETKRMFWEDKERKAREAKQRQEKEKKEKEKLQKKVEERLFKEQEEHTQRLLENANKMVEQVKTEGLEVKESAEFEKLRKIQEEAKKIMEEENRKKVEEQNRKDMEERKKQDIIREAEKMVLEEGGMILTLEEKAAHKRMCALKRIEHLKEKEDFDKSKLAIQRNPSQMEGSTKVLPTQQNTTQQNTTKQNTTKQNTTKQNTTKQNTSAQNTNQQNTNLKAISTTVTKSSKEKVLGQGNKHGNIANKTDEKPPASKEADVKLTATEEKEQYVKRMLEKRRNLRSNIPLTEKIGTHHRSLIDHYIAQFLKKYPGSVIVGFEFIIERYRTTKVMANTAKTNYRCELCEKSTGADIIHHMNGQKHKLNYMIKTRPDLYKTILSGKSKKSCIKEFLSLEDKKQCRHEVFTVSEEEFAVLYGGKTAPKSMKSVVSAKSGPSNTAQTDHSNALNTALQLKKSGIYQCTSSTTLTSPTNNSKTTKVTPPKTQQEDNKKTASVTKKDDSTQEQRKTALQNSKTVSKAEGKASVLFYKFIQHKPDVPLIGLQYLVEIKGIHYKNRVWTEYRCQLCNEDIKTKDGGFVQSQELAFKHVQTQAHMEAYLERHHVLLHKKVRAIATTSLRKTVINKHALVLLQLYGQQSIQVAEVNPTDNESTIIPSDKTTTDDVIVIDQPPVGESSTAVTVKTSTTVAGSVSGAASISAGTVKRTAKTSTTVVASVSGTASTAAGAVGKTAKSDVITIDDGPEETQHVHLYEKLKDMDKQPIVGLNYIIEVQIFDNKARQPKYECKLCDMTLTHSFITAHLIGWSHRSKFLKDQYPALHVKCERDRTLVNKFVTEIEAQIGRQSILVKRLVSRNPEGNPIYSTAEEVKGPWACVQDTEADKAWLDSLLKLEHDFAKEKADREATIAEETRKIKEQERLVAEQVTEARKAKEKAEHEAEIAVLMKRAIIQEGQSTTLGQQINFNTIVKGLDYTPLLGLRYIQEMEHPTKAQPPLYDCTICGKMPVRFTSANILRHICTRGHRLNYLRVDRSALYNKLQLIKDKESRNNMLDAHTKDIYSKIGREPIGRVVTRATSMWDNFIDQNETKTLNIGKTVKESTDSVEPPTASSETPGVASISKPEPPAAQKEAPGVVSSSKPPPSVVGRTGDDKTNTTTLATTNTGINMKSILAEKEDKDFAWERDYPLIEEKIKNSQIVKSARKSRFSAAYSTFFTNYPILGIQFVTEFQKPELMSEPWYLCHVCQDRIFWKRIVNHINSIKHRIKYMEKNYPVMYTLLNKKRFTTINTLRTNVETFSADIKKLEEMSLSPEVMLEVAGDGKQENQVTKQPTGQSKAQQKDIRSLRSVVDLRPSLSKKSEPLPISVKAIPSKPITSWPVENQYKMTGSISTTQQAGQKTVSNNQQTKTSVVQSTVMGTSQQVTSTSTTSTAAGSQSKQKTATATTTTTITTTKESTVLKWDAEKAIYTEVDATEQISKAVKMHESSKGGRLGKRSLLRAEYTEVTETVTVKRAVTAKTVSKGSISGTSGSERFIPRKHDDRQYRKRRGDGEDNVIDLTADDDNEKETTNIASTNLPAKRQKSNESIAMKKQEAKIESSSSKNQTKKQKADAIKEQEPNKEPCSFKENEKSKPQDKNQAVVPDTRPSTSKTNESVNEKNETSIDDTCNEVVENEDNIDDCYDVVDEVGECEIPDYLVSMAMDDVDEVDVSNEIEDKEECLVEITFGNEPENVEQLKNENNDIKESISSSTSEVVININMDVESLLEIDRDSSPKESQKDRKITEALLSNSESKTNVKSKSVETDNTVDNVSNTKTVKCNETNKNTSIMNNKLDTQKNKTDLNESNSKEIDSQKEESTPEKSNKETYKLGDHSKPLDTEMSTSQLPKLKGSPVKSKQKESANTTFSSPSVKRSTRSLGKQDDKIIETKDVSLSKVTDNTNLNIVKTESQKNTIDKETTKEIEEDKIQDLKDGLLKSDFIDNKNPDQSSVDTTHIPTTKKTVCILSESRPEKALTDKPELLMGPENDNTGIETKENVNETLESNEADSESFDMDDFIILEELGDEFVTVDDIDDANEDNVNKEEGELDIDMLNDGVETADLEKAILEQISDIEDEWDSDNKSDDQQNILERDEQSVTTVEAVKTVKGKVVNIGKGDATATHQIKQATTDGETNNEKRDDKEGKEDSKRSGRHRNLPRSKVRASTSDSRNTRYTWFKKESDTPSRLEKTVGITKTASSEPKHDKSTNKGRGPSKPDQELVSGTTKDTPMIEDTDDKNVDIKSAKDNSKLADTKTIKSKSTKSSDSFHWYKEVQTPRSKTKEEHYTGHVSENIVSVEVDTEQESDFPRQSKTKNENECEIMVEVETDGPTDPEKSDLTDVAKVTGLEEITAFREGQRSNKRSNESPFRKGERSSQRSEQRSSRGQYSRSSTSDAKRRKKDECEISIEIG